MMLKNSLRGIKECVVAAFARRGASHFTELTEVMIFYSFNLKIDKKFLNKVHEMFRLCNTFS